MEKKEQLYEGKAKKVFATDDANLVIVDYKDDATAFNGEKKGTITGKGVINNVMSNHMFQLLEQQGVPTHFVEQLSERETPGKEGLHCTAGGHHPQHFRRFLCEAFRRGRGHRIRRADHRVLLQKR